MENDNTIKLITIRTFDNPVSAHMLKTRLESDGIECFLFDENISTLNLMYNVAIGGIKLNIKSLDLEKAEQILCEIDNINLTDDDDNIVSCPKCSSTQLYSGFKSMKGIKGFFSAIISFSLMVFPIYYKIVIKCKGCGCEFKYDENKNAR